MRERGGDGDDDDGGHWTKKRKRGRREERDESRTVKAKCEFPAAASSALCLSAGMIAYKIGILLMIPG